MANPIVVGIVTTLAGLAGYRWVRRIETRWTRVTGRVAGVEIKRVPIRNRGPDTSSHNASFSYRYQIGGRNVEAGSLVARGSTRWHLERWTAKRPPGSEVELLVDPSAPDRCIELEALVFLRRILCAFIAGGAVLAIGAVAVATSSSLKS